MKKRNENDLSPYFKKQAKLDKSVYGKYCSIVRAIEDNTRVLKELVEILKNK